MILVIDGYNVLKQSLRQPQISERAKQHFIAQLNAYGIAKKHTIVVVFDGGPYWNTDTEKIGGITIVHSGTKESADDYIMRYLDTHTASDLLLISTDRDVCKHAWDLNIESIDAIDFYHLLQEGTETQPMQKKSRQNAVKLTNSNQPELDNLMHEASQQVNTKKENDSETNTRPSKQISSGKMLSKTERRMLKKIKKL
ncbi:hypothetical protein CVU75_03595 [Candidatus Dependentiae bacterium HGW-Dependentiae-1]|nr:MAG: hypothetical protein CVU75_03595 [Candidatus Dependentiae bacterium HGW-Dependentiae-1]